MKKYLSLLALVFTISCEQQEKSLVDIENQTNGSNEKTNLQSFSKNTPNSKFAKLKAKVSNAKAQNPSGIKIFSSDVKLLPVSTDFKYEINQWHLRNTNTYEAWKYSQGNKDLIVAVIDSGVDYNHPDLKNNTLKGTSFPNNDLNAIPESRQEHGTHVAGIIAGNGNIKGIAPNVKILPIKASTDGSFNNSDLEKSLKYAMDNKASIINMSLGSSSLLSYAGYKSYNRLIDEAIGMGINVVVSAGNDGYSSTNDKYTGKIKVIATDRQNRISSFTNINENGDPRVVSAPGVDIYSTVLTENCPDEAEKNCKKAYAFESGTSMAAPLVAGELALIKSAMYDDYLRFVVDSKYFGEAYKPYSYYEFFHSKQKEAAEDLDISITPSKMAEVLLFHSTNKNNRRTPAAIVYEADRDDVFGYGKVDVGLAVKLASKVFTSTLN
ncbi:MAG: S8 family serine peptidase [Candidatus Sericytochromatia bacterium]